MVVLRLRESPLIWLTRQRLAKTFGLRTAGEEIGSAAGHRNYSRNQLRVHILLMVQAWDLADAKHSDLSDRYRYCVFDV